MSLAKRASRVSGFMGVGISDPERILARFQKKCRESALKPERDSMLDIEGVVATIALSGAKAPGMRPPLAWFSLGYTLQPRLWS